MLKIIAFFIIIVLFSCRPYITIDRNGKKQKYYLLANDYKQNFDKKKYVLSDFNHGRIYERDSLLNIFESFEAKDLNKVVENHEHTLLVLWHPNCGSIFQFIYDTEKIANNLEKKYPKKFKRMLVSTSYDVQSIRFYIAKYLSWQPIYILPSRYGDKLSIKYTNFNKEIHPLGYDKYKDDIGEFYIFLFDKGKNILFEGEGIWNAKLKKSEIDMEKLKITLKNLGYEF